MGQAINTNEVPLSYWRAALAEIGLLHPAIAAESKPISIGCVDGAWQVTAAEPNVVAWAAAQFAASKAHTNGQHAGGGRSIETIPYVLVAARLSELVSHGVKREASELHKGLSILCLPCRLSRSGGLWPDPDRHPWIPRDVLEPTLKSVAVGHLDDYDQFVSGLPGKAASFEDTLRSAAALFKAVTGAGLPSVSPLVDEDDVLPLFALDGYALVAEWHGVPYEPPVIAKALIKLYDQIMAVETPLPLLENLRTTTDRPSRRPLETQDAQPWHISTVGHINRDRPLWPSQREAMVELARLDTGQILAVNGPPGTGKTTLLQSVVAQLWVNAALEESECPLIVVASTNVKAVENVLNGFAKICVETGHERWHPYDGGFGLFLASESRTSQHPTCTTKNHPYSEHETVEAVEVAEKYFLERASIFLNQQQDSVVEVVKVLHARLQHRAQQLKAIVVARYDVYRATGQSTTDGAATSCKRLLAYYQEQIEVEQSLIRVAEQELAACRQKGKEVESDYETTWSSICNAEMEWNAYLANSSLWLDLLNFLPPIRQRRVARDRCFLMSNPLTADLQHRGDDIASHFVGLKKTAMEKKSSALALLATSRIAIEGRKTISLKQCETIERAYSKINQAFRRWHSALKGGYDGMLDVSLEDLNKKLDTALRAPMFGVADWYWSGRWLLEMKDRLKSGAVDSKGRAKREAKYRRFAKLSPCLVSNFHVAPSFFTAWQGEDIPFWNTIDLLIVDEAGQVSPDIGAAMFALAKRALVVGDIHQIEPVWNNGEATDRANAVKFGLISSPHDPRYDALSDAGYTPASGNLMRMANRSCTTQKYSDLRGLMLTEHRRCVPELVSYCNALIYAGRLEPKRERVNSANRILPAFGYLDTPSQDKKVGGSRQNYGEAQAIVDWLKAHRAQIEAHYPSTSGAATPLWDLVGIVTPFAAQAGVIERLLRKEMPDLMRKDCKLVVGTVHALQGAERAIVIFSPTYGASFTGSAFFDLKPNMLNVAVSRARDSFLVIGNLALFDATKRSRPSGLLASYLFHGDGSAPLKKDMAASAFLQ